MIEGQKVQKEVVEPVAIICDDCKTRYEYGEGDMEIQEFLFLRAVGGFSSVFGDGAKLEMDLCQHCQKKRFGDILRVDGVAGAATSEGCNDQ